MLPVLNVQPHQLRPIPGLPPYPLMFILLEMITRCSPLPSTRRHCHLMLLHLMQGLCSHPPAAVVPSMAAGLPLLGALVTCSKAAMSTNWSFSDLAAAIKLQLLLGCQVLELLGGMLEGLGGAGGSQQQHGVPQQQGGAQHQSQEPQCGQQQGQQHQQNGTQMESHERQHEGEEQQQWSGNQRHEQQRSGREEQGRESGSQQEQSGQLEQGERSGSQRQEQQRQEQAQQQLQQQMVKLATGYLEHLRSQKQQQHFQTPMQQLSDVEEWDGYSAAAQPAVEVIVDAFTVAAATAEQGMNEAAKVGEPDKLWGSGVSAAVRAAAAAHLDSAPSLAAVDAADKAGVANVITLAIMEHVLMAMQAAIAAGKGKKTLKLDFGGEVLASMVESVSATKAGLAVMIAALGAAAPAAAAAAVAAMTNVGSNSAGTVAEAGVLPGELLEGRSQGHDSACLKEQVEGLVWAGLFSINSACALLQRLSCALAEAIAVGCGLTLGQRQLTARYPTADKVLLAAIRKAEEALAGQSQLPSSAAAAAAAGGGMLAAAAAAEEKVQAAGSESAAAAGAGGGADAGTVAAEGADKLAAAEGTSCVSAGKEIQLGAAAEGSSTSVSPMSYHATIAGLREVASYAKILQETLQEGGCFRLMNSSDVSTLYYSLLEQQGPWFILEAASHVALVRRLDWESRWVEQCSNSTSEATRELISAGLGGQQGSKVGDKGMGLQQLTSSAGDVLHDVVLKLPQQLLVEGSVLGEVRRKVMGWRGTDVAGRAAGGRLGTEHQQQQVVGGKGGVEESYREFAGLFLVLQSCLWGVPVSFCCNNVGCRRVGGISELAQVHGSTGGGGFCQACKLTCYCTAECHRAAAPFHRHACKPCESKQ